MMTKTLLPLRPATDLLRQLQHIGRKNVRYRLSKWSSARLSIPRPDTRRRWPPTNGGYVDRVRRDGRLALAEARQLRMLGTWGIGSGCRSPAWQVERHPGTALILAAVKTFSRCLFSTPIVAPKALAELVRAAVSAAPRPVRHDRLAAHSQSAPANRLFFPDAGAWLSRQCRQCRNLARRGLCWRRCRETSPPGRRPPAPARASPEASR